MVSMTEFTDRAAQFRLAYLSFAERKIGRAALKSFQKVTKAPPYFNVAASQRVEC
jgi:hypothetical protein